jgi:hypothetical protein
MYVVMWRIIGGNGWVSYAEAPSYEQAETIKLGLVNAVDPAYIEVEIFAAKPPKRLRGTRLRPSKLAPGIA